MGSEPTEFHGFAVNQFNSGLGRPDALRRLLVNVPRFDPIDVPARKVVSYRVISTVDPQPRHGHKSSARGFDGYKCHIALDPDTEIITATKVTPGNSDDAEAAENLLADIPPAEAEAGRGLRRCRLRRGELQARLDNGVHNRLKGRPPTQVKDHFGKNDLGAALLEGCVTWQFPGAC